MTVYTVAELAGALKVSRTTIYRLIASGRLNTCRVGTALRITQQAVNQYLTAVSLPVVETRRRRARVLKPAEVNSRSWDDLNERLAQRKAAI